MRILKSGQLRAALLVVLVVLITWAALTTSWRLAQLLIWPALLFAGAVFVFLVLFPKFIGR